MDEEIDRLIISVRADTATFTKDVAAMRGELEGPLVAGAGRAGRMIENALTRAITTGKLGFDDLKRIAMSAMAEIASASLRAVLNPGGNAGGGIGAGMIAGISSLVSGLLGAPGRATGGPVAGGRSYLVGERGPELFVPGSDGRIVRGGSRSDVKVAITIRTPAPGDPQILRQSSRQVARAVRSAIRANP